jgi:Tfp pilus assembly protein PilZ
MTDIAGRFREYVRLDRLRRSGHLSPEQLVRWKLLKRRLAQHFSPGLSDEHADRRESVRLPARVLASFRNQGELARCLMTNLSRKGLFLETRHLFEIGSRFTLTIHVDDPLREIEVPVEVVSQNVGPGFQRGAQGMGLRFLDPGPEVEKEIDDFYERLVE